MPFFFYIKFAPTNLIKVIIQTKFHPRGMKAFVPRSSLQWLSVGGYLSSSVTADRVEISRIYKLTTRPVIDGDVEETERLEWKWIRLHLFLFLWCVAGELQRTSWLSRRRGNRWAHTHLFTFIHAVQTHTCVSINHIRLYADDAVFYISISSWIYLLRRHHNYTCL